MGSLWASCDDFTCALWTPRKYKDYVLVPLFVKYVSDKYAGQPDALIEVSEKGRKLEDMVTAKGDKEIGDKINKIIGKLAAANNLRGVIDRGGINDPAKLGSGKEIVDRLTNLVTHFSENRGLDFCIRTVPTGDDILGDAYEYLMRHFCN